MRESPLMDGPEYASATPRARRWRDPATSHVGSAQTAGVAAAVLDLADEAAERVALPDEPGLDESWEEPAAFGGCWGAGQSRPDAPQPIRIVRRAAPPSEHGRVN